MSNHVTVISEWIPETGCEDTLWTRLKELMKTTETVEGGCLQARCLKQIAHPNAKGKSKYLFVLMQEYDSVESFDVHCESLHVRDFVKRYVEGERGS